MPWRSPRPNPAGGQNPRRYSFMEKMQPSPIDGQQTANPVRLTPSPAHPTEEQAIGRQPSHSVTRNLTAAAQELPDIPHAGEHISSRLRPDDAATAPRSHRSGLFRFGHASDSELSRSYIKSAPNSGLPLHNPPAPTITTTAPAASPSRPNGKPKHRWKMVGRFQNQSREDLATNCHCPGSAPDGTSQTNAELGVTKAGHVNASRHHISFEQPNRLSTYHARGAPPPYGDVSRTSLSLPPSRLSVSSRSDASSVEHGIYAETTTTHTVSTTTTFFRLPRRKKDKPPLFPLPLKSSPPESNVDAIRTARSSRSGRTSVSPAKKPSPDGGPVTALYQSGRHGESDSKHLSPLPSPTRSNVAPTNPPLGFHGASLFRKDSVKSHRSGNSTPSTSKPPPFLGSRGRSSTISSLNKVKEVHRQPSPQVAPSGRTSTSTSGRKSFGDLFSLSHIFRQNTEPPYLANAKTLSGTPGTPASTGSKSNSFQIPREVMVYPERAEGDTPATYLTKLEEAVHRGVIAAILCKGSDDFSKTSLRKYMRGFSYFGDSIDMAVRKMLMEVELPKETQQIDRLLQGFADRYCECNPGIFVSTDEAYFVTFSILLLHSDTHNKNNKRKMQKSDYVKNTQDQVEVSSDILECFYDNVSYTPFIHFEDEVAINSHRLGAPRPKKALFRTTSTDNLRGPVDPYALILDQKLEILRPSLKDVMDTEDNYSCTGTSSSVDASGLYQAFHKASVLQIVSARSRPDAFLSQATISNPAEAQVGLVDIKAAKVGSLWRKDQNKKKGRSPWQEWGALLTGSQLYFFKDVGWVKTLISQYEAHQKAGSEANPVVFRPPLASFQPDALLSMDDAVALLDTSYKKHKHAFLFIKHGGFEEVFLANNEGDMNDWIAKLNYAATFRTAGVRMRGFIGANYEGQRPELSRNQSATSARSLHLGRDEWHTHGRQINQQLAGEILAYRRQMMIDKIAQANEKLATTQKELDNLLRNARHLQICSPIQGKTREALVLAAGRMSAKLKWTRVEMWKIRCHRNMMKMDLEQEVGSTSAASILRESSSLRSRSQSLTPLMMSNQSLKKVETKDGDVATSPKSTLSKLSSPSTPQALLDITRSPDALRHTLTETSFGHSRHLSSGSIEQSMAILDNGADIKDGASLLSIQSPSKQSLDHRPSINSSHRDRSDADSLGHSSRLTTPTQGIDDEARLMREAGLIDSERQSTAVRRPDTSESERDLSSMASRDSISKDRSSTRRNLHRTLRDSQHTPNSTQSPRHRKGKEHILNSSPSLARKGSSQNGSEGLTRSTGSFIVHGKKASVIQFGSEWQSMAKEDHVRPAKLHQPDEQEICMSPEAGIVFNPKAEEMDQALQDRRVNGTNASVQEESNIKLEDLAGGGKVESVLYEAAANWDQKNALDPNDLGIEVKVEAKAEADPLTVTKLIAPYDIDRQRSHQPSETENTTADNLPIPSLDLRRCPTPQAIHA